MVNRALIVLTAVGVLGCSTPGPLFDTGAGQEQYRFQFQWEPGNDGVGDAGTYANVRNLMQQEKPILALYREDVTHDAVVDFFVSLAGSSEIALPMLYHAEREDISLSLVFALAWVESRYAPDAVNMNATSADRGLFQLNSRTFRELTEEDFFHPDVNTYHGITYLRWCLDVTGDEYTAVAVYNAGLRRVRAGQTPRSTQIHVRRIAEFRETINRRFERYITQRYPTDAGV